MEPQRAMGDMLCIGGQHNASLADGREHLQRRRGWSQSEWARRQLESSTNGDVWCHVPVPDNLSTEIICFYTFFTQNIFVYTLQS